MTFDPIASKKLKKLFANKSGHYPYLLNEAELLFENASGSKMHFRARSPRELANILRHCINHDGTGIFNRQNRDGSLHPISFRMFKRTRLQPDNKEYLLLAFNIRYQDLQEKGHLWMSDPEVQSYYWLGNERIEDKPPMTFDVPNIHKLIQIMEQAGDDWRNVEFSPPNKRLHLKLVHSKKR